jgi:Tol biopolymer transport system component
MRSLADHTSQLALLSILDGSIRSLKSIEGQRFDASLSPDGKLIAYDSPSSPTTQARDIFVVSVDGGGETAVVQNPANDAQPVWSPDGSGFYS